VFVPVLCRGDGAIFFLRPNSVPQCLSRRGQDHPGCLSPIMPGDLSYSDTGQLTARSERGAGKQDLAHRHDARRWSQTSGSLLGRGQANGIGLVPSSLRLPPHRTIRCLPFTMASATNPSAANGSMSRQTAAKWCEMRIAPQQTLPAGLFANQWRTRPQGWPGGAVRRLGRHQPGGQRR
jgi:hypothetical protein